MTSGHNANPKNATDMNQNWIVLPIHESEDPGFGPALREADAEPAYYPCLQVEPLDDHSDFEHALRQFSEPAHGNSQQDTWILVTTPAAAQALLDRVEHLQLADTLPAERIAALGATAYATLRTSKVLAVDDAPDYSERIQHFDRISEGENSLVDGLPTNAKIIVPTAEQAYEPLIPQLKRLGYTVHATPAYARFPAEGGDNVGRFLFEGSVEAILFTSPEQLRFFRRRLLNEGGVLSMLDHVRVYCMDPWTADVAAEYGLAHAQSLATTDPAEIVAKILQP